MLICTAYLLIIIKFKCKIPLYVIQPFKGGLIYFREEKGSLIFCQTKSMKHCSQK